MANFISRPESQEELDEIVQKQMEQFEKNSSVEDAIEKLTEENEKRKEYRKNNFERSASRGDKNAFLLLVTFNDGTLHWEICEDRAKAYEFLKWNIEDIDLIETQIISETLSFVDSISAASFLVHVIDSGKIVDPGFDPMDYIPPDYDIDEDEFE